MEISLECTLWQKCLQSLENIISQKQFNQWITPLQAKKTTDGIALFAPNQYVLEGVERDYLPIIEKLLASVSGDKACNVYVSVGVCMQPESTVNSISSRDKSELLPAVAAMHGSINPSFRFDNFIEGKSNQLAKAASAQVAESQGGVYNPLFLYGGVGLGKTHLMHAIGNMILKRKNKAKVVYLHSERFVIEMVSALKSNVINDFKKFYRSVDALLVDDIQFLAGKEHSQEEFFHTFNALLEGRQQIILTSDRYPKKISGIEERLKSRFGSGLTISVEPPDLETRAAILMSKAEQSKVCLPYGVALFIAQKVNSNVRELEGIFKRVVATAHFTNRDISMCLVKESLKDVLAIHEKLISMDSIIKTVVGYYGVKVSDVLSKKRNRMVATPRQVAMYFCKELTNHSFPEIGVALGGRDHTTVLHACKKIKQLTDSSTDISDDVSNILRILST